MVQAHGHVGTKLLLDRDGALGGELEKASIEVRPEGHTVIRDPAKIGKAKHLESARVGEDRPLPAHE